MFPDFGLRDEFRPGPSTVSVAFYVQDSSSMTSKDFDVPAIDVGDGFLIYLTDGRGMLIPKIHRRPYGD